MENLEAITVSRKSGSEPFLSDSKPAGINVLSFWQWSSSNLLGNAMRGVLAEFIVASALGCHGETRRDRDAFNVKTKEGIRVEVKSSGYLQSWSQAKLSKIQFGIKPTVNPDESNQNYSDENVYPSDVHVFCVLAHKLKKSVNPLNIDQWNFYVISTKVLYEETEKQKTISLKNLLKLEVEEAKYHELSKIVRSVAAAN